LRHGRKVRKLGRTAAHRRALMRNLVQALFQHERIQTTLPKAKEASRQADRLVTFARSGSLAARRQVARFISDRKVLTKLFDEIAGRFADRAGGYTRIYRLGPREGDGAEMALLELVVREDTAKEKREKEKAKPKSSVGKAVRKRVAKAREKKGRGKEKS